MMKNKILTFETSKGRVRIFDDISHTRGISPVSGMNWNSTPVEEKIIFAIKG